MKIRFLNILSYFLISMVVGTSCKKGTFDINSVNPNDPNTVPVQYVLSGALNQSASVMEDGNAVFAQYWMGYWTPSGDFVPDLNLLSYRVNTDFGSGNWNETYITLKNYKYILENTEDSTLIYVNAIARIMWAYHFQNLVDIYNNVPYSDAFNNLRPAYSTGSEVYADLLVQLDKAIEDISKGALSSGTLPPGLNGISNDIVFKGVMLNWQAFAYNLKLKILLHESNIISSSEFTSAMNGTPLFIGGAQPSFFEKDVTVNPGYTNTLTEKQNPKYANFGYTVNNQQSGGYRYNRANAYAVNFYNITNDARGKYISGKGSVGFYDANGSGINVQGRAFGSQATGGSEGNNFISAIGPGILKGSTQDAILMPASETFFLIAEALERGLITSDLYTASSACNKGIETSYSYLFQGSGLHPDPVAEAYAFIASGDGKINIDKSTDRLGTIYIQKWAALNGLDPLESWNSWKRTGYPTDLPVSIFPGVSATHVPYRLQYPTSEFNYNPANVNAQGTIDPLTSKIFWMP